MFQFFSYCRVVQPQSTFLFIFSYCGSGGDDDGVADFFFEMRQVQYISLLKSRQVTI
jgi:hypothetical protein